MTWSLIRVGLFTGAFSIGMLLSHAGLQHKSAPTPVLAEDAGASLVVACNDGAVVVDHLKEGHNAIQLHCLQSRMVVVRDQPIAKNVPAFNRINAQFH